MQPVCRMQLGRDRAGAGRDVEDGVAGPGLDARDEEAAPARVLAEREQMRVAVVRRPERGEQRLRVLPSGRDDRHGPSLCIGGKRGL